VELKNRLLAGERSSCPVRRVSMDLRDRSVLRAELATDDLTCGPSIAIAEGLLVYLDAAELGSLVATLANARGPVRWLADVVSPRSAQAMGVIATRAGTGLRLYGLDDLDVFEAAGWVASEYRILPVARSGTGRGRAGTGRGRAGTGVVS